MTAEDLEADFQVSRLQTFNVDLTGSTLFAESDLNVGLDRWRFKRDCMLENVFV